ncbi:MAG: hypothetical protein GY785_08870 [Gammaproteobacteria bacterium]|nr:hypothetical protein [Gammaproteobacteria bacterium]
MNSRKIRSLLLPLLACCTLAVADHKPAADWSWHVVSAGADESRLSVYQQDQLLGIYNLSCDLTDVSEGQGVDDNANINLVKPESNPEGLLVISCNVGAHSRQITIIELARHSKKSVFSATGSYTASWEIQDGELWIGYDEPCDAGLSVDCPDGFVTTFVQYPQSTVEAGSN